MPSYHLCDKRYHHHHRHRHHHHHHYRHLHHHRGLQEHAVLSEDRIEQQHHIMRKIGTGPNATRIRAELQGKPVLSGIDVPISISIPVPIPSPSLFPSLSISIAIPMPGTFRYGSIQSGKSRLYARGLRAMVFTE